MYYYYLIIAYSSNFKTIILFFTKFALDFSGYRIDLKLNKYLFHIFNLFLLAWQDKKSRSKVKNENKKIKKTYLILNKNSVFFLLYLKKNYNICHLYLKNIFFPEKIIL